MRKLRIVIIIVLLGAIVFTLTACNPETDVVLEELATFTSGDFQYLLIKRTVKSSGDESTYAIASLYVGKEEASVQEVIQVVVPATVTHEEQAYPVQEVGALCFHRKVVSQVVVSEGINSVESFAFGYSTVTQVTLPASLNTIGSYAFVQCVSLKELTLKAHTPPVVGEKAFTVYNKSNKYEVNSLLKILVPAEAKATYQDVSTYPDWKEYQGILS